MLSISEHHQTGHCCVFLDFSHLCWVTNSPQLRGIKQLFFFMLPDSVRGGLSLLPDIRMSETVIPSLRMEWQQVGRNHLAGCSLTCLSLVWDEFRLSSDGMLHQLPTHGPFLWLKLHSKRHLSSGRKHPQSKHLKGIRWELHGFDPIASDIP